MRNLRCTQEEGPKTKKKRTNIENEEKRMGRSDKMGTEKTVTRKTRCESGVRNRFQKFPSAINFFTQEIASRSILSEKQMVDEWSSNPIGRQSSEPVFCCFQGASRATAFNMSSVMDVVLPSQMVPEISRAPATTARPTHTSVMIAIRCHDKPELRA